MVALRRCLRPALVAKIIRVVQNLELPNMHADPIALEETVRTAVDRAMDVHGLSTEAAIADYAGLMLELGPAFDRDSAVATRLGRDDRTPEARLNRVFFELSDEDWLRLRTTSARHVTERVADPPARQDPSLR